MKSLLAAVLFLSSLLQPVSSQSERGDIRVMFYNVENLFDTINDPKTNDEEFTPSSLRNWNYYKYSAKLNKIFKVIANVGEWEPPEVIGFCEVENLKVLEDLINKTPLYKYKYEIAHYDSPDKRGIDVACLYRKDKLKLNTSTAIPLTDIFKNFFTRDILHVSLSTMSNDTLHFFINHWPSRRGGQLASEPKRLYVSKTLTSYINNNLNNTGSQVIVMGDFNDDPLDLSVQNLVSNTDLIQIPYNGITEGSLKYDGRWNVFDQILISKPNKGTRCYTDSVYYIAPFTYLLENDSKHTGKKPFRTYNGLKYNYGYSDHLPIYIDLYFDK